MSSDEAQTPCQGKGGFVFKKRTFKNRKIRKYNSDDEAINDDTQEIKVSLGEIKERQKLRDRPNGVSVTGLALGKKLAIEEEINIKDPFNTKVGGMINMQALKTGKLKGCDDAYDVGIGTQFSAETNKRDEDEEMMKYIEEELRKRKGVVKDNVEHESEKTKYMTPEEAALFALPDHLRQSSANRSEEMLSNQMLNGIPEVDLGIEAKIKNIEATEDAKQRLLQEQKNKKDGPSVFVPTNMAVNFMQHNRFNIEEPEPKKKRREVEPMEKPTGIKKATDDYHYDKFKKQFRRF